MTLVHEGIQNTKTHSVGLSDSSPIFQTSSRCTVCAEAAGEGDIFNTHLYRHRQWTTLTDCDHELHGMEGEGVRRGGKGGPAHPHHRGEDMGELEVEGP